MTYLKRDIMFEDFLGIDGFDVYWYGFLIAMGFLLAFLIVSWMCKKRGYKNDLPTDMLIIAIIGAIVGARLYYVVFEWSSYQKETLMETLKAIVDIRQGGLAIYGGVIGGILGMFIYSRVKKINTFSLLDVCAGQLALGQAIGRWGNFFNQEAHGGAVTNPDWQFFPYAVYIDSPKGAEEVGWYQATFFYESVWCLIIFGVLLYLFFRQKYYGQLTLWYLALYGFERGIVEWLRTDQLTVGGLPVSALLSIVLFIGATTALIVLKIKKYEHPIPYYKRGEKPEEEKADA